MAMALEIRHCCECGGTGRNGKLGGYRLVCWPCHGTGLVTRAVAGRPILIYLPQPRDGEAGDG